ncbi:PapD-like protein [Globomyces pollinis-pini]|nr:PapD-like protein [Globomyces pollinis-pini]KAJ2998904.1 phosphatidylinositol-binding protein scs2 [Globomyces sp. JEL0801]
MDVQPENELIFQKNSSTAAKQVLFIKNNHADVSIAYKVKTTAPKLFCVKPNSGRLDPGERAEVTVILQSKEAVLDPKRRDKFLVQSIKIPVATLKLDPASIAVKITELWVQAEQIKKASPDGSSSEIIEEKKLRCVYSENDSERLERISTVISDNRSSVSNFQDSNEATKPLSPTVAQANTNSVAPVELEKKNKELNELKERLSTLQAACDGYKAELERVNLLRQRRADATVPANATTAHSPTKTKPKSQGIAFQSLAILCLVSFLLGAWLF